MNLWALTIFLLGSPVNHGKFLEKSNCEKVGKQLVGNSRQMRYTCKLKFFKVK